MTCGTVSPALRKVARGALCSGCGGCALVAPGKIAIEETAEGFLRPEQTAPLSRKEESTITAICPALGQSVDAANRTDHTLWGPYRAMHTGWATDPALRHRAASGGGLSGFLTHLLASGTVEGIVQTAADPDAPLGNIAVISRSVEDISTAAGSRYAPSAPLAGIAPLLDGADRFAFVGKPCDVAALRALAARDPRIDRVFPVLVAFFCAGVPSLRGAEAVVRALDADPDDVIRFRYRGMGWPGRATADLKDGSAPSMTYNDSWGKILSKHVQHRCKICADGTGVAADIAFADAWVTDDRGYPLFEEQDGISLIVARTDSGAALLAGAADAKALVLQDFDVTGLEKMQPGQSRRRRALLARLAGLALLGKPVPRYTGLHLLAAARGNSMRGNLVNFLGMLRRVLKGRIGDGR